jgi:hypothetical protein
VLADGSSGPSSAVLVVGLHGFGSGGRCAAARGRAAGRMGRGRDRHRWSDSRSVVSVSSSCCDVKPSAPASLSSASRSTRALQRVSHVSAPTAHPASGWSARAGTPARGMRGRKARGRAHTRIHEHACMQARTRARTHAHTRRCARPAGASTCSLLSAAVAPAPRRPECARVRASVCACASKLRAVTHT